QPYVWPWEFAWGHFGTPLGAHADYQAAGQMEAKGVAQDIAAALSLTFTLDDDPAVDVVFLIDSTPNATGAITELKARSSELTDVVDEASDNYRVAVVDYKGASIGNPYTTRVAQDFTTDPAGVDDAIDDLVV